MSGNIDATTGLTPRAEINNLSNFAREQKGNEMVARFPELLPGTAVLDLADGTMYEVFESPIGRSEPMAHRRTENEEYCLAKYQSEINAEARNDGRPSNPSERKQGFDDGHMLIEAFVTTRKVEFPGVNPNGEVVVTEERPSLPDLTRRSPDAFAEKVLGTPEDPSPVLLLDRGNAEDYSEMYEGDPTSYEIRGLYRPYADDERVVPLDEAGEHFAFLEDGLATDPETREFVAYPQWGFVALPQHFEKAETFGLSPTDEGVQGRPASSRAELHLSGEWTNEYGEAVVGLESPYEKKGAVKALPFTDPRDDDDYDSAFATCRTWDGEHETWVVRKKALEATINYLLFQGETVSVEPRLFRTLGEQRRQWLTEAASVEPAGVEDAEPVGERDIGGPIPEPDGAALLLADDEPADVDVVSPMADDDLSLTALDMALANNQMDVQVGADLSADVPADVCQAWNPGRDTVDDADALEEAETAAWYHPEAGHRVIVTPVVGEFGPEYRVDVAHGDRRSTPEEHVATVASETHAAAIALTHLEAMTGF